MTEDWAALGRAVTGRRIDLGYRSASRFARERSFGLRTLNDIENARRTSYSRNTFAALEKALGWSSGSISAVLTGRDATPLDAAQAAEADAEKRAVLDALARSDWTPGELAQVMRVASQRFAEHTEDTG